MRNNRRALSSLSPQLRAAIYALTLAALLSSAACQSGKGTNESEARGVIVVNAPAAGVVRRVLAREGVTVEKGAPLVEIAVQTEMAAPTPNAGESAESRAVRNFRTADVEIEAARSEAVRHEAEVQRLTPLVASGEASPAQLEGERALYERAQQRLQQAQDAKRRAESGLLAARQPGQNNQGSATPTNTTPREQLVNASAPAAGTVSVVTARVGERVTVGQPLATLRTSQP